VISSSCEVKEEPAGAALLIIDRWERCRARSNQTAQSNAAY